MPTTLRHRLPALLCLAVCVGSTQATAAPGPSRPAAAAAKPSRAAGPAPSAPDLMAAAAAERDQVEARAAALDSVQTVEASARWLSGQAWDSQDPWIHLMAAKTWLKVQTSDATLDRAAFHAQEAVALADAPPVLRIAAEDVARVHEDAEVVQAIVAGRRAEIRRARAERRAAERRIRRGRHELIAGGAMMLVGALGGGVALAGSSYRRRFDETVAPILEAELPIDLAPLRRLDAQGSRMVAAGIAIATIGAAAGVPLLVLGGRDLRLGRRQRERAMSLRLAPGPLGVGLAGRF